MVSLITKSWILPGSVRSSDLLWFPSLNRSNLKPFQPKDSNSQFYLCAFGDSGKEFFGAFAGNERRL